MTTSSGAAMDEAGRVSARAEAPAARRNLRRESAPAQYRDSDAALASDESDRFVKEDRHSQVSMRTSLNCNSPCRTILACEHSEGVRTHQFNFQLIGFGLYPTLAAPNSSFIIRNAPTP